MSTFDVALVLIAILIIFKLKEISWHF